MTFSSKKDYQDRLFEILNPLLPHYRADNTRLLLGYTGASYTEDVAEIEGFARVLWGLAPYFCGGGSSEEFEKIYLQGITNGTDPNNPNYWGEGQHYGQMLVEMAAVAVAVLLAPKKLWDPLTDDAKKNLTTWLATINKYQLAPANWQFFGILVNVALLKLGAEGYNEDIMQQELALINSFYRGNGWYQDGTYETFDYYSAFAMQYYGLIYAAFMEKEDPENSQAFKERAKLFGPQFIYWFDESGAAVPYGRSLTYRFAQVAFFSACIFAGVEPVSMSTMKGVIDRHLDYWWRSHMQDFSGILTIGYTYPNLIMAENYNSPGSPLWALKAFLILALDDDHPYWSAEAGPYPTYPEVMAIQTFPETKMTITHRKGYATLYPGGMNHVRVTIGHAEEKYAKFAYNTWFGFSVRKANDCLENMAPDSELVFEIGGFYYGRVRPSSVQLGAQNAIISQWSPYPGVQVTSNLKVYNNGYIVRNTITSEVECVAYGCGFALPTTDNDFATSVTGNTAEIKTSLSDCIVRGGEGLIITASPNTSLIFPRTAIPAVKRNIPVGTSSFQFEVLLP